MSHEYKKKAWYDVDFLYSIFLLIKGSLDCQYCIAWRMFAVGSVIGSILTATISYII